MSPKVYFELVNELEPELVAEAGVQRTLAICAQIAAGVAPEKLKSDFKDFHGGVGSTNELLDVLHAIIEVTEFIAAVATVIDIGQKNGLIPDAAEIAKRIKGPKATPEDEAVVRATTKKLTK